MILDLSAIIVRTRNTIASDSPTMMVNLSYPQAKLEIYSKRSVPS